MAERDETSLPAAAVDRLYAGSPEQFTAERNALAKKLRADGENAAAQRVAKQRKPTVAAWLVNQLAHNHRKALNLFLVAADELREAQEQALSGKGAERFRKAQSAERDALERLVDTARRIGDGVSESTFDRVRATLEAALADPQARASVEAGRLEKELRPGAAVSVPKRSPGATAVGASVRKRELADAKREIRELRQSLEDAEAEEARQQEATAEAEERLRETRKELREAQQAAKRLRSKLRTAKKRLEKK